MSKTWIIRNISFENNKIWLESVKQQNLTDDEKSHKEKNLLEIKSILLWYLGIKSHQEHQKLLSN